MDFTEQELQNAVLATLNHYKHPRDRQMAEVIMRQFQQELIKTRQIATVVQRHSAQVIPFPHQPLK